MRKDAPRSVEDIFGLFRSSPSAICIADYETGIYLDVNKSFCDQLGVTREEAIGKTSIDLELIRDANERGKIIGELRSKGSVRNVEVTVKTREGAILDFLLSGEVLGFAGTKYLLWTFIDNTARKEAERAMTSLNESLQDVLRNMGDAFISFDREWRFTYVNDRAEALMKIARKELLGKVVWDVFPYARGTVFETDARMVMTKRVPVAFEWYLPQNRIWVSARVHPFENGVAFFLVNITAQKEASQAMQEMNEKLEQKVHERTLELTALLERKKEINEMQSRFVSMASHEFRTPLAALLTSVSILEQYIQPAAESKELRHFDRIKSSVGQLVEILNDFLSLDKLESGRLEIEPSQFDLQQLAEETLDELNVFRKRGQEIVFSLEGDKQVYQDRRIVQRLLYNLLSNSLKFSGENQKVWLMLANGPEGIGFTVHDEGIGIPEDEQQFVFSRLFRARNAAHISGTGLGLNIVKRYIELLHGDIRFTSGEGKGTTFRLQLPAPKRH